MYVMAKAVYLREQIERTQGVSAFIRRTVIEDTNKLRMYVAKKSGKNRVN